MRMTFLGAGEFVESFCRSLVDGGHPGGSIRLWARADRTDHRVRPDHPLAKDSGVVICEDLTDAIDRSEWIISAVTGSQVVPVARQVADLGPRRAWYLDVNSADPEAIREAASLLEPLGWWFLDAGVMGPAPLEGHRTPMVLSGKEAEKGAAQMRAAGFVVRVVGQEPGQASALKLLRNLIGKNFAAVVIEALLAGELLGVREIMEEYVLETLQFDQPQVRVDRWVSGTAFHAARRLKEQAASADLVERAGGPAPMTRATCSLLSWILSHGVAGQGTAQDPAGETIRRFATGIRAR